MEAITSIAKWLFLNSIYGIAIIAAVVYFFAIGIKKVFPRFPNPIAIAVLAFIVALSTFPSVPRYQFEKEALSQLEGKDWIRVINKTKWGSLIEPLTWFHAPVGSIFFVMPNSPVEGGFREVSLRYEEKPHVRMTEPDCKDHTIMYAEPDKEGVFRYTLKKAQPMSVQETSIYCEYDWAKEIEALRAEMLKQINSD